MNIHLSARTSVADVTQFLEAKVHEIMTEYHIDWSCWGHDRMRRLCSQASGLFIWAVTAIEYIRSEIEEVGRESLDVILDELDVKGMDDINTLYRVILKRIYRHEKDPWDLQRFQRIVGATWHNGLPYPSQICKVWSTFGILEPERQLTLSTLSVALELSWSLGSIKSAVELFRVSLNKVGKKAITDDSSKSPLCQSKALTTGSRSQSQ